MTETQKKTSAAPSGATSGRAARGRFGKGNPGGPGNPFNRRIAELRRLLMEAVSTRLPDMVEALMEKALQGDVAAIKVALEYSVGKPLPAADPDRVDIDEYNLAAESMVSREAVEAVAIDHVPAAFATALADVEAKVARMEMLFPSPEVLARRSRAEQTDVRELVEELADQRQLYLEDAAFRRRWNENCRQTEQVIRAEVHLAANAVAPVANGVNGDATPSYHGGNGGGSRQTSVLAPDGIRLPNGDNRSGSRQTSVLAPDETRLPNGDNGQEPGASATDSPALGGPQPFANGDNGGAAPSPNGGNGSPGVSRPPSPNGV